MSANLKKSSFFPITVASWFNDLPNYIKILVGTHEFFQAVMIFIKRSCWHREHADCSLCHHNKIVRESEIESFENLMHQFLIDEEISKEEFEQTFDETYFEDYDSTLLDTEDVQDIS